MGKLLKKFILFKYCCCLVTKSYPTLCNPMNCSTPGFSVHYHLPEFPQTHVHWVSDAIQPSHPLSPSSWSTVDLQCCVCCYIASYSVLYIYTHTYIYIYIYTHTHIYISQRRQWHPTPVLLPGKSHGWMSLVGYRPWGRKELDTTERLYLLKGD